MGEKLSEELLADLDDARADFLTRVAEIGVRHGGFTSWADVVSAIEIYAHDHHTCDVRPEVFHLAGMEMVLSKRAKPQT